MSKSKKGATSPESPEIPPIEASSLALFFGDVTDTLAGIPWAWHIDPANHLPPVALAFDLGKHSAAALLDGPELVAAWHWTEPRGAQLLEPMRVAKRVAAGRAVLVGAEWTFISRALPNGATSLALAARAGSVCTLAEIEELPAVRVLQHSWSSRLFGKRLPRDEGKKRNRDYAIRITGRLDLTEDESDAVCFAAWLAGRTAK